MNVVGELIAERYELEQLIGSGGMASVFRAYDRRLERRVAVKILDERWSRDRDLVERFRREARAVAGLSHPNIVTVLNRGECEGRQYIVFEYVAAENLKQLIGRSGPLPVRRALELAIEIGRGLAFAHLHGVVHRDVKPQNVLLGEGGAKVTDFGIAHAAGVDELTLTGTILGTSDYLAPEQANGQQARQTSDVYSLGVVLFELLTGDLPFRGEGFLEVAVRRLREPAPSVLEWRADVPARLAAAVGRALEKDPARRFPSMDAFVAEFDACLAGQGQADEVTAVVVASAVAPRGRTGRRAWPVPLVFVGLLLSGAAGAVYFVSRHDTAHLTGARPALAASIHLRAVGAYDPPPGDGVEDNPQLPLATDGNPATYWATEWYTNQQFGNLKSGVGVVLDAGMPVRLEALTVHSDTPGFTAIVKAGPTQAGPFQPISQEETVATNTTFPLHVPTPSEYYLLWITRLSPGSGPHYQTHINEVTANKLSA